MADPGDGDLAVFEFGKNRTVLLAFAWREPRLPDEFLKKSARVEMFRWRQILERSRKLSARRRGTIDRFFRHTTKQLEHRRRLGKNQISGVNRRAPARLSNCAATTSC